MFERQGTSVSESTVSLIREIARTALGSKKGVMYAVVNGNGDVGSILFFLLFKKEAYYLIGANNPAMRKTGAATYLFSESFKELREIGVDFIDFVGVNSPNRGDYKTSFGAELHPYFDFSIRRVS